MRGVIAILLSSVVLPLTLAAQKKNDLQRNKLKGAVKEVIESEYEVRTDAKSAEKGKLKSRTVYRYNDAGNRIDFISYSEDSSVLSRSVYNYNDTTGALDDVKRYRGDGGLNVTTTYKFDAAGNESEEANTDPSGTLFMTGKSMYDLNGNRIRYDRFNQYGHLFLRSNIRYDKKGNEIQEKQYDSHESLQYLTTWEYSNYDKQGNWQYRVMLKNDEPRTITERKIIYRK